MPGNVARPRDSSTDPPARASSRVRESPAEGLQADHQNPFKLRLTFSSNGSLLDECLVAILSWVAIRCSGAVRSRSPEITSTVRCGEALILPRIAAVHAIRAARAAVVSSIITLAQTVDQAGKFLLHDHDALLDDGVRLQVAGALDLEVELVGDSVKLKWLAGLRWLLECGVFAFRPALLSASRD